MFKPTPLNWVAGKRRNGASNYNGMFFGNSKRTLWSEKDNTDIWQKCEPVEDFPMFGEKKVYIKKDSVWLPRKEYGSLIDE